MSDVRWEGFSHEEIYSRVQQGPGPLASADAEAAWSTVESTIRTVDAQLTRAVKQIGAGWQGRAAKAVQGGMTVMSNWALDAAGDASLTKNGISAQAEQAGRLRSTMPPPRTAEWNRIVQEEVPGVGLVSAMGDLGALEEQMADEHAVAVEMMNRYSSQSSDNQRLMNYWTQPPTVVVEAASARATTSTAPLGAAGAVGTRSSAGGLRTGSPADGSSSARGADPSSAAVPAAVGFPDSTGAAPSAGGRGGAGTPAAIGPPNGEPSGRVGSAAVPGRAPGAVDPYADAPVGPPGAVPGTAAGRGDPAAGPRRTTIPVGVPPGAEGRPPGAVGRWPRSGPSVGDDRPVVPGPPARSGGVTEWRTGLRTAPATPLDTAEPPARVPPTPATGFGEPPPRAAGPAAEAAAERVTAGRPASAGHGILPMGGAVRPTEQAHARAAYLIDDTDAFADDRWFPPPVIRGDAPVSPRGG